MQQQKKNTVLRPVVTHVEATERILFSNLCLQNEVMWNT